MRSVRRLDSGVGITDDGDGYAEFDAAVIATHPGQALAILAEPTAAERAVLGAIGYSRNPTTLHTDPSALPRSARVPVVLELLPALLPRRRPRPCTSPTT